MSSQQKKTDPKIEIENLMEVSRNWSKDALSRDVDKALGYWSDDAIVLYGGQQPLAGKNAIRQMVEESYKDSTFAIRWEPVSGEVSISGDLGYLIEDATISTKDSTGKEIIQAFKTVSIWKKQTDGTWKCIVDVMNPIPPVTD